MNGTLAAVETEEEFADLAVFSMPQNDDEIEISLILTSKSSTMRAFAEEIFENFVGNSIKFSRNPEVSLPTPAELGSIERKPLEEATFGQGAVVKFCKSGLDTKFSPVLTSLLKHGGRYFETRVFSRM
jgi:hypothetical protein